MIYLTNSTDDRTLRVTQHKAKKKHECQICQQKINKGESYTRAVFIYDGYFASNALHNDCASDQSQFAREQALKE